MLTLPAAGQRIQREVAELEETVNTALAQLAALTQSCALARNLPGVAATTGQPVLLRLSSLNGHLTKGSGDLARIHRELLVLGGELEVMMPDQNGECPPLTGLEAIAASA